MEYQKTPTSKRNTFGTVLIYLVAVALFLAYANLEMSSSEYNDEFELAAIERLTPTIQSVLGWSTFIACLIVLVASSISFGRRWLRWPAIGLAIALVLYPYCLLLHVFRNAASWTTHGQVVAEDGAKYVFCDSSFLQGQRMAIAQVTEENNLRTVYRVLVDNFGDSPRSWASIIRPEGSSDIYGQLYLKNSHLIGVRCENKCYLAYDLVGNTALGHGDIESLPLFACLSTDDAPCSTDVQRTCDRIMEHAGLCDRAADVRLAEGFLGGDSVAGCPPKQSVFLLLSDERGPLRSIAQTIMECYDEAHKVMRTRIAKESAATIAREQSDEPES